MNKTRTSRLLVLAGSLIVIMLIYLGLLYDTQVVHYADYLLRSRHSIAREETIEASRGVITDRKGRLLVSNDSIYNLTFDTSLLHQDQDQNQAILRLVDLCTDRGEVWADDLPVSQETPYRYTLDQQSESQRRDFFTYLKSLDEAKQALMDYLLLHPDLAPPTENDTANDANAAVEDPDQQGNTLLNRLPLSAFTSQLLNRAGLSAARIMELMLKELSIPDGYTLTQQRKLLGVRYELALRRLNGYTDYVMVEDIDTEFISLLSDGNYVGAKITSSSVRHYETTYAAHILGIVGAIGSREEFEALGEGYNYNDYVGKSGVEAAFETYLKGKDGRRVISTNSEGRITGEYYSVQPEPGNTVELTIDLDLQQAVEDALAETVTKMSNEDGIDTRGAGAAVIKVGSGDVLALASYPTYDLSTYGQNINELNADPAKPMQNRATQSTYPPGSTFKPLVSVAALEEGVVTLTEKVSDRGRWYYPDIVEGTTPWGYNCWIGYPGHGLIDISRAITVSCNTFFYEMGYRLGIDRLSTWAAEFGLGQKTGIEIGEKSGTLASRENRESTGGTWYGGDTVMAAIGQSDNLFTPIQLANYVATLVSGGKRYETHLLKTVKTYNNAEVVAVGANKPLTTIQISDSTLDAVKKGMHDLTTSTLAPYFSQCVVSAGAKTGTAQLGSGTKNNGVFVCFAPYDNPEIAVSIVIEKGESGSALASTAVKILNAYFRTDEIGTMILPENQLLP